VDGAWNRSRGHRRHAGNFRRCSERLSAMGAPIRPRSQEDRHERCALEPNRNGCRRLGGWLTDGSQYPAVGSDHGRPDRTSLGDRLACESLSRAFRGENVEGTAARL